jgi:hypothetical protein
MTRGSVGAHLSREVRFGAIGHVAAPEPTSFGEVWSHRTRDSAGAHLRLEVRSGAAGHVAAPKPTSTGM